MNVCLLVLDYQEIKQEMSLIEADQYVSPLKGHMATQALEKANNRALHLSSRIIEKRLAAGSGGREVFSSRGGGRSSWKRGRLNIFHLI